MKRHVIGYQITNHLGTVVHGERDIPFATCEVLTAAAATEFLTAHSDEDLRLLPIYRGDIENPTFTDWYSPLRRAA